MKEFIKILMCSWLFCGQVRCDKELIVLCAASGKQCQISVPDEANLGDIFKAIANADKPEFVDAVLNPMKTVQLVDGTKVLINADCESLPNRAELTLISQDAYFVPSKAVSNKKLYWSEALQKWMMNNEERFVLHLQDRLWMVFYGVNYKTNGWNNYINKEWDPESSPLTYKLAKWFLNDPKDMTIKDKYAFFQDLDGIYCHRIELIERTGSNLIGYVLNFDAYEIKELFDAYEIKELCTKLLGLENTDEVITEDKLPKGQWASHQWIESQKEFSSTYGLFPVK